MGNSDGSQTGTVPVHPGSVDLPVHPSGPVRSTTTDLANPFGSDWQRELAGAVRYPDQLLSALDLDPAEAPSPIDGNPDFPLLVPRSFIARMRPRDWNDPLLRQVLPLGREQGNDPAEPVDAVGDIAARRAPGMIHKYQRRVLLITNGFCGVNCRYCFRRHYPYDQEPKSHADWQAALQEIAADHSITEVILSGGDPLTLHDRRLETLVRELDTIEHLRRIRWHTRMPIVLPSRVTEGWLNLLTGCESENRRHVVVLHANHARELQSDCAAAIRRLSALKVLVLNQAVLLKGINDSVKHLEELCECLFELGVQPYYLHQLDEVRGTTHFEVPVERGLQLMAELRCRLPGYLLPSYVREEAGQPHKTGLSQADIA